MRRAVCFLLLALFLLVACNAVPNETETVSPDTQEQGAAPQTATATLSDSVLFGAFPQQNNAPEPIEWLVLTQQDGRALLLSKDCLASLPWHNAGVPATWDVCDLRGWLNRDFWEDAFTEEERDGILSSDLDNGDDLGYGSPVGENTRDRIFLLSASEVNQYLPDSSLRVVKPTGYAVSQGAYANAGGYCAWWLRSPGMNASGPAYLSSAGDFRSRAHEAGESIIGVRPAMWVAVNALTAGGTSGGADAYPLSMKECTREAVTISLDAAGGDALLALASYAESGEMLACAITDRTVKSGASATLSVPYSDDIHHIRAFVVAPDSFTPLREAWSVLVPKMDETPFALPGQTTSQKSNYVDKNGDAAVIPADFRVSEREDEQAVQTGLVVIGPDDSEFVWIPVTRTNLARRDFGSYMSATPFSGYRDETELESYQAMASSVERYGGFYMGRYEASFGGGDSVPSSRRVTNEEPGRIWVRFAPQDAAAVCENLYAGNDTVRGFFPWGVNWDTMLQWLIDSGGRTEREVASDSTGWGNYSDDAFSPDAAGGYTGQWEEAKANNLYDLAGNNWEWTRERYGSGDYVMRGGGYNLMGGPCPGSRYPAALRDPLPGNNRHPNVTFRPALYLTESDTANEETPRVYFTSDISPEGLIAVYEALGRPANGNNVAVKLSTGEANSNYLRPALIGDFVRMVDGTIVECNTAVGGRRSSTAMHYQLAREHGFTEIAPVVILDEKDDMEIPLRNGKHLSSDLVGARFSEYDFYVILSHFKGHLNGGFGGAIKNMSIGIASSAGKNRIHTAGGTDTAWLRFGAAKQDDFLESMAEASKAVADYCGDNILYINVMNRLSVDCDCAPNPREPQMADIGILASTDPVALDQACVDLAYAAPDGQALVARIESLNGQHTLDYGEEIGLGSKTYTLVNIDKAGESAP